MLPTGAFMFVMLLFSGLTKLFTLQVKFSIGLCLFVYCRLKFFKGNFYTCELHGLNLEKTADAMETLSFGLSYSMPSFGLKLFDALRNPCLEA